MTSSHRSSAGKIAPSTSFAKLRVFVSFFVFTLVVLLASPATADYNLKLYRPDDDLSEEFKFTLGPTQRYSLSYCYVGYPTMAEWEGLQSVSWIVFFNKPNCHVTFGTTKKARGPEGTYAFGGDGVETFMIASFMVWESGTQPTRGIIDYCLTERAPNANNPSAVSNCNKTDSSGGNGGVSSAEEVSFDSVGTVSAADMLQDP